MGLISRSFSRSGRAGKRPQSVPKAKPSGNRYNRSRTKWRLPRFSPRLPRLQSAFAGIGYGILGLALVGGITLGLLYGYRFLTRSPYFAVKSIVIKGNFRLTSREILELIALAPGDNSLALSISSMEKKLAANPWVRKVSVQRTLPDGIAITIEEEEPRFWVRREGKLYYADIYGNIIAAVVPGRFASYPTLEVAPGAESLVSALPELVRALFSAKLPVDTSSISMVRLSHGKGAEIFLDGSRMVFSLGQEDLTANLTRLALTLEDLQRRRELTSVREVRAHGPHVWVIKEGPATGRNGGRG